MAIPEQKIVEFHRKSHSSTEVSPHYLDYKARIAEFTAVASALGIPLHQSHLIPLEQFPLTHYDTMPSPVRMDFLIEQTIRALSFAAEANEFTARWFEANSFEPERNIQNSGDLTRIPLSNKELITRNTTHGIEIIVDSLAELWFNRGFDVSNLPSTVPLNAPQLDNFRPAWIHWTGGSSKPEDPRDHLLTAYANADARMALHQLARAAPHLSKDSFADVLFSLYADHIAHDVLAKGFAEGMRDAFIIPRIPGADIARTGAVHLRIIQQLNQRYPHMAFGEIFPPKSHQTKSDGLSGLELYANCPNLANHITTNLHSSTATPPGLLGIFRDYGMRTMDAAGCNEVLPPVMSGIGAGSKYFKDEYFRVFDIPALTLMLVPDTTSQSGWRHAREGELALITWSRIASLVDITTALDRDIKNGILELSAFYEQHQRLPQKNELYLLNKKNFIETFVLDNSRLTSDMLHHLSEQAKNGAFHHYALAPPLSSLFINYSPGLISRVAIDEHGPSHIKQTLHRLAPDSLIQDRQDGLHLGLNPRYHGRVAYTQGASTDGGCGEIPK